MYVFLSPVYIFIDKTALKPLTILFINIFDQAITLPDFSKTIYLYTHKIVSKNFGTIKNQINNMGNS